MRHLLPVIRKSMRGTVEIGAGRRHGDLPQGQHQTAHCAARAQPLREASAHTGIGVRWKIFPELAPFIADRVDRQGDYFPVAGRNRRPEH